MDRRRFGAEAARMLLGGASLVVVGCGGGSSPTASDAPPRNVTGTISDNHGHSAVVTAAQLGAGGDLEIDIRGTSSHPHTVSLTASEVRSVRAGSVVRKESTGSSHTHTVVFNG